MNVVPLLIPTPFGKRCRHRRLTSEKTFRHCH
uniref:Uncharacterized protein n=1 Tax=Romanomermis culicivorax TaxID=13658 RepID=A0A915L327_ROMCU